MKLEIKKISGMGVYYFKDNSTPLQFLDKNIIADLFIKYGGSFTKYLGEALLKADLINTWKILTTWEDQVEEYINKFLH